ncbi:MAG: two-component system NarL family capsular synthesis sensor histidine kinase RcsC [Rhodospirillaceae bacterium]|nr:MAG: two-component system NarL family capsular synthesis sensor histidine kinase RcsC [Rhodospirillaceae bacterium]
MGGTIGFTSTRNNGSIFWFGLPFEVLDNRRSSPFGDVSAIRVLVVSPEPRLTRVLEGYLRYSRAEVETAVSGAAALARCAAVPGIDVVLADSDVGDMSGLNFAKNLAAGTMPPQGAPQVVLMLPKMSAFAFMDVQHEVLFTTLSKPVRRLPLCHVVAAAAGRIPLQDQTSRQRRRDDDRQCLFRPPSPETALATGTLLLVAEDNPTNQTVISMQLERPGYVADVVEDGLEAWKMLQNKPYGLLLTDCHMPEMDGYALTQRIRDQERQEGGHLPVVALTADAVAGTAQRCQAVGMDHYLKKPVSWQDLDSAIQSWLPAAASLRTPVHGPREMLHETARDVVPPSFLSPPPACPAPCSGARQGRAA